MKRARLPTWGKIGTGGEAIGLPRPIGEVGPKVTLSVYHEFYNYTELS